MRLKDYQNGVLDTLSGYLGKLTVVDDGRVKELADIAKLPAATRAKVLAMLGDPVTDAWNVTKADGIATSPDPWRELKDGIHPAYLPEAADRRRQDAAGRAWR